MNYADIDENLDTTSDLDDKKFVKSREAILLLLPKLFPNQSARWSKIKIVQHFIDETVEEIARIWLDQDKTNAEQD